MKSVTLGPVRFKAKGRRIYVSGPEWNDPDNDWIAFEDPVGFPDVIASMWPCRGKLWVATETGTIFSVRQWQSPHTITVVLEYRL